MSRARRSRLSSFQIKITHVFVEKEEEANEELSVQYFSAVQQRDPMYTDRIQMIDSFRPLPLMKGCRRMTYHLTVHTVIIPMSKITIKLTTMYLTRY